MEMMQKMKFALLFVALALPGALALASDELPQPQINTSRDGWFFAAGGSYIGVLIQDVTTERLSALKLKEERGAEVTMVDQDAPAGKAGLKEHDVILDYNGTRVESAEQLHRLIHETPPGRTATLGISRDGSPMTIKVQVGDRAKIAADHGHRQTHENFEMVMPRIPEMEFNIPFDAAPVLGVQVDPVGRQLAEFFGVKGGEGLLVRSVEKGSAADKAGMKAGDVITRVDNEKIGDRSELRRLLRSHREGGKVTLGIVRDKREQNVTVDLPARKSRDNSSLEFSVPDMRSLEEIQSRLRDLQPMINQQIQENLRDLQPQLMKARMATAEIKPQVEKAMREAREALERARKEMKEHQKEWERSIRQLQMI
jgi:C-terminal processing protease CtpA/Prc